MKALPVVAAAVLIFCAGAAADGLYRGPLVRAALARADSLQERADTAQALADSLHGVAQRTDTVRVTAWIGVRAAEKLVPPVCAPLIAKVEVAARTDSGEIADLKSENAALRREVADLDTANTALRTAAKHADGALFHLFGLSFARPSVALGVTPDAPLKPRLFVSLLSIQL